MQEKKTKYMVKQARGGQFSENKRDAKNNGVEWDVCMISKTYSSVLKLFWESLSLCCHQSLEGALGRNEKKLQTLAAKNLHCSGELENLRTAAKSLESGFEFSMI